MSLERYKESLQKKNDDGVRGFFSVDYSLWIRVSKWLLVIEIEDGYVPMVTEAEIGTKERNEHVYSLRDCLVEIRLQKSVFDCGVVRVNLCRNVAYIDTREVMRVELCRT